MFFLSTCTGLTCPSFSCKKSTDIFAVQQCIYSGPSYYSLSPCTNPIIPYCNPSLSNTLCTIPPSQSLSGTSWPGEACTQDSTCKYGVCFQSRCNSKSFSATCQVSDECNPGLYCSAKGICEFQLEIGAKGCTADSDCVNSAGCNAATCVQYFSLAPLSAVDVCQNNINLLCSFSTCASSGSGNVCGGTVTSFQNQCSSNSDCVSSVDPASKTTYLSQCVCAYSVASSSYCTLLPGDSAYASYLKGLGVWLSAAEARQCNTKRRMSTQCIQLYSKAANDLLMQRYYVQDYPMIKNNDNCTQAIFNQDYWELYRSASVMPKVK